jgi:hypothetical protein
VPRNRVRRLVATTLFAVPAACLQQARALAAEPPTVYGQYPGRDQFSPLAQIGTLATPMSFLGSDGGQYVAVASGALSAGLLRTLHNAALNSPEKIYVFAPEH